MKRKVFISCVLVGTMLLSASCNGVTGGESEGTEEAVETVEETETEVAPVDLGYADVEALPDEIYTGDIICPVPVITADGHELEAGTDYTLTYEQNVNIGTATIYVEGNGSSVTGSLALTFNIITGDEVCDQEENAGLISFVDRLYVHLLGRYPTLDEMTDNVRRLRSGSRSGMELVNIIIGSPEFTARELDEVAFVQAFYLGVLNRNADEDGLWYNVNLLWNGMDRLELANGIMDVPGGEFDNICTSLGIDLGNGHVTGAAPIINDGIPSSSFNYIVDGRTVTIHRRVFQFVTLDDDGNFILDLDAMLAESGYSPASDDGSFTYVNGVCTFALNDGIMTLNISEDEIAYYEDTTDDGEDVFFVNGTDTQITLGTAVMIEYSLENVSEPE